MAYYTKLAKMAITNNRLPILTKMDMAQFTFLRMENLFHSMWMEDIYI